jgi:hypothetical protein
MTTRLRKRAGHVGVAAAALALAAITAPALGAGDYGADTCLNGYVWREATPADHVCVTPLIRMQTARQNAEAAAHRSPTGGPYGPDTCVNGYVWREAVANDHVCVFPAWRQQARDDNAQAKARRNSLHVWLTYYRPSQPPCTGDPCSRHSDDAQRYRVRADHINVGKATVLLRWTDRGKVKTKTWPAEVKQNPNAPGGLLVFASGMLRCTGATTPNGYFAVRDPVSLRWSGRVSVRTGCATL